LHTGEEDVGDAKDAYRKWRVILEINKGRRVALKNQAAQKPACSLVEFLRTSPSRKNID
jgi:hypothetical protein